MKSPLRTGFLTVIVLAILIAVSGWILHEERPVGEEGPAADALARRIQQAVNLTAWEQTGAVSWHFPGRDHLWDRQRNLHRIS